MAQNRSEFADRVATVLNQVGQLLVEKNTTYGDSALDPVRVFSRLTVEDALMVRVDDKLSRIARGSEFPGDDTLTDLVGYLVLLMIARGEHNATGSADTDTSAGTLKQNTPKRGVHSDQGGGGR